MPRLTDLFAEIEIAAPANDVWRLLTQSAGGRRWMNGAEVRSAWTPGADIEIDVVLEGVVRHDRGTVLAIEPGRLLRYSYWSEISRRPDAPDTRSEITFELREAGGRTFLRLAHSRLTAGAAGPHARFFWQAALAVLRDEAERRQAPTSLLMLDT